MSTNPVYAFFATPKSFGPLILRVWLAVVFFYHGSQKAFALFGGDGWNGTMEKWAAQFGLSPVLTGAVIVTELFAALGLFLGFFTRLFALAIVGVMTGALVFVHGAQGIGASEYPATLLAAALALVFVGGGRFSADRGISGQLLPAIG